MTSVAVDGKDSTMNLIAQALEAGIQAARRKEKALARRLLLKVAELDPSQEKAWLWLAAIAETSDEALAYLQTVLALNPNNRQAQEGIRWVQSQLPSAPEGGVCPVCKQHLPPGEVSCPTCGHILFERADKEAVAPLPAERTEPPTDASAESLPGFALSVEQAEAIDAILAKIAYESEARCIILADVTGQLISERGQTGRMNTQVLSALAAGELAATHEMARLVGEEARFKLLLHEGQQHSVYLSDIGGQMLLIIVFDQDTPIGLVRMILKNAVQALEPVIAQAQQAYEMTMNETLGDDFAQLVEDRLTRSLA